MYIRGRHIIGRRLAWERGAGAFGYPRGSGSGNLNSDDARETGSHLTAPVDCGMRVNGMRSSGLRYPPPWTGRGGRDSGPRRGEDDDTDDRPGRFHPSGADVPQPADSSIPRNVPPVVCCDGQVYDDGGCVGRQLSHHRHAVASLLCRRRDAVPCRPGETGEGEGGWCLCLWRELVPAPAPAWLLPS